VVSGVNKWQTTLTNSQCRKVPLQSSGGSGVGLVDAPADSW